MLIDPKEKTPLPQTPPAVEMLFLSFLAHFFVLPGWENRLIPSGLAGD